MKHSIYRACLTLSIAGLAAHAIAQSLAPAAPSDATAPNARPDKPPDGSQPKPPVVTCNGDQLTIVADDSTINAVLTKLRACIGVDMSLPSEYRDERIFIHLGPGPRTEILDSLLASTDLNYVITTSTSSPSHIMAVNLTIRSDKTTAEDETRSATTAADAVLTPARRAWLAAVNAVKRGTPVMDDAQAPQSGALAPATQPSAIPSQADSPTASTSATTEHNADHSGNHDQPAATSVTTGAATAANAPTPPEIPPSTDARSDRAPEDKPDSAASPALQKQIDQMQQLFEQRKKMMAEHSSDPASQP